MTRIKVIHDTDEVVITPLFRERQFVFDSKLVFVVMPFGEPWSDRVWDALQRIIQGYGLRAERADNRHGPVITEDIWRGVVEARVVLADVTSWNPNVFYELGICHTLGKDVILITQPSARLPFDTQGFRHIIYSDNPSGIKLLEEEIPQKLDYYLKKVTHYKDTLKKVKKPKSKEAINLAWKEISKNWDPPLPSASVNKDARSQAGALKKRMKEYVYGLSEGEAKTLVSEIRKEWPDDLESQKNPDKVQQVFEKVTQILNEWRVRYSAKIY